MVMKQSQEESEYCWRIKLIVWPETRLIINADANTLAVSSVLQWLTRANQNVGGFLNMWDVKWDTWSL